MVSSSASVSGEGLVTSVFLAFTAFKLVESGRESGVLRTSPDGGKAEWLCCCALLCNRFVAFGKKVVFTFIVKVGSGKIVAFETFPGGSEVFATVASFSSDFGSRHSVQNYNVAGLARQSPR